MGGMGSGCTHHWWRSTKTTVEACLQLDANRLKRLGILKAGFNRIGSLAWYRGADKTQQTSSMAYEVWTLDMNFPSIRLTYTMKESKIEVNYPIRLTTTRPRFGGLRWWFICPLIARNRACNRRVGKLYLPPGGHYFGCRHCYDLTYTSCQESHKFDGIHRAIARNMGVDFETVKRALNRFGKG